MNKETIMPRNINTGNLPIFNGTLNFLDALGFLYLRTITERFIIANVRKMKIFERFATNSRFLIKANAAANTRVKSIASQGVLLLLWTMLNFFGSDFSSDMPQ